MFVYTHTMIRWVLSEPAREQAITAGLSAEELGAGVQGLLEKGYEDTPEGATILFAPAACNIHQSRCAFGRRRLCRAPLAWADSGL